MNDTDTKMERVQEWARKRLVMVLAYLDWLAETARLDLKTLHEIERLYPDLSAYAKLGEPLRGCSQADLQALAARPALVVNETDLTKSVKALGGMEGPGAINMEGRFLAAWISGRRR